MNHDDARKLMSGYATGSLTEAERKALMEAALEDQGLFDELADEAALKEILDEPGARQRLLAAVEPPRHRTWLWALVPATLAIVIGIVVLNRTPQPQQIAGVVKSPELPTAAPAAPAPAPVPKPTRKAAPPAEVRQEKLADRLQEANPKEFGALGGAAPQALRARTDFAAVTLGFGFSYTVLVGGSLQITPAEPGFLTVIAGDMVIFPSNPVPPFTPVTIPVPSGASSVIIGFSRMPAVTGTPERRDTLTGRETDQDPPNGRILIQLFLKPATQ